MELEVGMEPRQAMHSEPTTEVLGREIPPVKTKREINGPQIVAAIGPKTRTVLIPRIKSLQSPAQREGPHRSIKSRLFARPSKVGVGTAIRE
jgi:hypothetical protein